MPAGTPHDTDPWVFGDQMLYCYGKQVTGPVRRRTSMQNLAVGSVICFGSTIGGEFCVDTHTPLTLYRGATVDRPVHGMYSFVPARPATRPRFRRPPVRLATLIKPASTRAPGAPAVPCRSPPFGMPGRPSVPRSSRPTWSLPPT